MFHAPDTKRPSFPEAHPQFQGMLLMAMGPLSGAAFPAYKIAEFVGSFSKLSNVN